MGAARSLSQLAALGNGPAGAVRRHILLSGPLEGIFNSFFYISDPALSELVVSLFPHCSSQGLSVSKFNFWVLIWGIKAQDGQ